MIGEPSFEEGQDYLDRSKVLHVEFRTPVDIHGEVSGIGSSVYSVSAHLMFGPDDRLVLVAGECSCSVDFNCKHVAALLLAAEDRLACQTGARHAGDAARLPGEVRHWLGLWPGTMSAVSEVRPTGPPVPSREHLFYVIHRDWLRGMCISPYRAYLKKDGTIGTNFRPFDRRSSWARNNLTVQDAGLIGKLDFFADYNFQPRYDWPEGDVLVDLVREIVETGRARAHEIRGMTMCWAPPRQCELVWEVSATGEQHLVARDAAGSQLTLLPFPTPFFFDPATGETGITETELSPRVVSWFADAPAVPIEAVDAVASRLSRFGQSATVPQLHRIEQRTDVRPEPILTLYGCEQTATLYGPGGQRRTTDEMSSTIYPCARLEFAYEGATSRLRPGGKGDILIFGADGPAIIRPDHARESGFRKTLSKVANRHGCKHPNALRSGITPPRGVLDADIVFPPLQDPDEEDAAAAGIGFVAQAVPALRSQGWHVEIDRTWPFSVYEGPITFTTSAKQSSDPDWFSLALSLEANGRSIDITQTVLQIVQELPVDKWGQLEEGFDVDRHLAGMIFRTRLEDGT